jgi:hypothetical protein
MTTPLNSIVLLVYKLSLGQNQVKIPENAGVHSSEHGSTQVENSNPYAVESGQNNPFAT